MADSKDEMVINTIQQIIKEVKQEMQQKKVLTENKTPQVIFEDHDKKLRRYIAQNILKVINESTDK